MLTTCAKLFISLIITSRTTLKLSHLTTELFRINREWTTINRFQLCARSVSHPKISWWRLFTTLSCILGHQKIFLRMKVTTFLMVAMTTISSPDVSTGQARCNLFSPVLDTPLDYLMFGDFHTSCTKAVEVGQKNIEMNVATFRWLNDHLALMDRFLAQHLSNWLELNSFLFIFRRIFAAVLHNPLRMWHSIIVYGAFDWTVYRKGSYWSNWTVLSIV